MAKKKEKKQKKIMDVFFMNLTRRRDVLRFTHHSSLLLGIIAITAFVLVVFFPTFKLSLPEPKNIFSYVMIAITGVLSLICVSFYMALSVLRVNIRSGAELQEERIRRLSFELQAINYQISNHANDNERIELLEQYDEIEFERDFLISQSPRGLKEDVSTHVGKILVASRKRLLGEEDRLLARNVANLAYGIIAAILGVSSFMVAFIISYSDNTLLELSFNNLPFYYLLCVPITIISEVVAIFFLRLFAITEKSIERNKNEITNIELRLTACQLLDAKKDKDKFDSLADVLSKEERNFVLDKNQSSATTIDIEKLDLEKLAKILLKLAPKVGGS